MTTVCLLDAMTISTVGRVSASVISRSCGVTLQCCKCRYFSVSVTLSESLTLFHANLDANSSLSSGTTLGVTYLTISCDGKCR